ncbi:MAG: c-type cytochrome [Kofleriaceae bacterium]|nr:c-type cytochrome [Kofleriaceae bacterium]
MRVRTKAIGLSIGLITAAVPTYVLAKSFAMDLESSPPTFALAGRPVGGPTPAPAAPAHLTSSRIAAAGAGALVIDQDSGALIQTDANGKNIGTLAIGRDAGLLSYDAAAGRAYVADRRGDKIHVVAVGAKLELAATWKTPAEPYAVALTPDRKTLLVATIADRSLVAFDTATGKERWRASLGREPRGLAISPDGTRALVSYLSTGTVDQIDLLEAHRAEHLALSVGPAQPRRRGRAAGSSEAFARASFAVTFLGANQAVVPFQRETPVQETGGNENVGSYGGGFDAPINHQLAFVGFGKSATRQTTAQISQHQPRALAWDGKTDTLWVAGMGTDTVLQLRNASQATINEGANVSVAPADKRCGPDGLAVASNGDLLVWCAFTRSVARVSPPSPKAVAKITHGASLIASSWSPKQHEGMVLFHASDASISQRGALACASCHPDNRADGLSWRIDKHELQTPVIAGRMVGTHPFKWDGGDKDLKASLAGTIKRLGGTRVNANQNDALVAYIEALPSVRTPTRDVATVARGKQLFDGEAGCRTCHDGNAYTDQERHKLTGTLAESDTPSLLGLAASAPYFHDGSAATLEALLRDRGAVHGMTDTAKLTDKQVADLVAFLETL